VKIDPKHVSGTPQETPAVAPGRRGREGSAASPGSDELVLSSRAEEFRRVRPQLDGLPESGQERIVQIRAQLLDGTYRVSGEQIAEAMLRDETIPGLLGLRPET
jgi:flagellar biosynthesis anti-sigma factor FlgM